MVVHHPRMLNLLHSPSLCCCACRGLAQVALAQEDTCQALHHYGELVSKALMGRGSAEHWAYAEYGWLLFQVSACNRCSGLSGVALFGVICCLFRQTG